jgi:hypothetical protein
VICGHDNADFDAQTAAVSRLHAGVPHAGASVLRKR